MVKKFLVGSGLLIALYLAVSNATGLGKVLSSGGSAASGYARTLQGR